MGKVVQLTDSALGITDSNDYIYPITKTDAVFDEAGNNISEIIEAIKSGEFYLKDGSVKNNHLADDSVTYNKLGDDIKPDKEGILALKSELPTSINIADINNIDNENTDF